MGMDYLFSGSASYPRFNDELSKIVELFGGSIVTNRKPANECTMVEYFMEAPLKYIFKEGTPGVFIKWANDPYGDYNSFTFEETKELYIFLKTKWNKVKEISSQIANELKTCYQNKCPWSISY